MKNLTINNIIENKDNVKNIKNILDRYIISKKEKQDLLNDIINIKSSENQTEDDTLYMKTDSEEARMFELVASNVRFGVDGELVICPLKFLDTMTYESYDAEAFAIRPNDIMYVNNKKITIIEYYKQMFENAGLNYNNINFISKEEFYKID